MHMYASVSLNAFSSSIPFTYIISGLWYNKKKNDDVIGNLIVSLINSVEYLIVSRSGGSKRKQ